MNLIDAVPAGTTALAGRIVLRKTRNREPVQRRHRSLQSIQAMAIIQSRRWGHCLLPLGEVGTAMPLEKGPIP